MKKHRWHILAVLFLVVLSACSSTKEGEEEEKEEKKKPKPICPQVAIVRQLEHFRDYGGEESGADQLVSEGRMANFYGDCEYEDEGVDIAFELTFYARRGPRLGADHVSLPFFIAVLDPEQNILNKDKMTVEFKVPDEKVAERKELLHVFIPLDKDKQETGPNYQVLLGFQLTKEQLEINRSKEALPGE